ncbi:MAG: nucleotidyltransferase domain-containing protein [candidate division WOR-3 bacterium]
MIKKRVIKHDIHSLISDLKEALYTDAEIIFAYIFGSYGIGKPTFLSDIDIACYLLTNREQFTKKLALIEVITSALKTDEVDLVFLNNAPIVLCYQVLKTGKLLFSKDERLRLNFIKNVYDFYCDAEPLRVSAEANLIKRIKENQIGIRQ